RRAPRTRRRPCGYERPSARAALRLAHTGGCIVVVDVAERIPPRRFPADHRLQAASDALHDLRIGVAALHQDRCMDVQTIQTAMRVTRSGPTGPMTVVRCSPLAIAHDAATSQLPKCTSVKMPPPVCSIAAKAYSSPYARMCRCIACGGTA